MFSSTCNAWRLRVGGRGDKGVKKQTELDCAMIRFQTPPVVCNFSRASALPDEVFFLMGNPVPLKEKDLLEAPVAHRLQMLHLPAVATKLPEPLGPSKHAILRAPLYMWNYVEHCDEFRGEGIGDSRCAHASWVEICCRIPNRFLYAEQTSEPP